MHFCQLWLHTFHSEQFDPGREKIWLCCFPVSTQICLSAFQYDRSLIGCFYSCRFLKNPGSNKASCGNRALMTARMHEPIRIFADQICNKKKKVFSRHGSAHRRYLEPSRANAHYLQPFVVHVTAVDSFFFFLHTLIVSLAKTTISLLGSGCWPKLHWPFGRFCYGACSSYWLIQEYVHFVSKVLVDVWSNTACRCKTMLVWHNYMFVSQAEQSYICHIQNTAGLNIPFKNVLLSPLKYEVFKTAQTVLRFSPLMTCAEHTTVKFLY